jgi:hypothetical protein
VPAWLLGKTPLSKLALSMTPYRQLFRADRSHLCRIAIRFAPRYALHTGAIRIGLYAGEGEGRLVTTALIRVAELPLDVPYVLDFPAEVDSYNAPYTLLVAAAEVDQHSPGLWHFWQPQHAGAQLMQGNALLHGELAIQPFFREKVDYLPPRQGPAAWDAPIRLAPTFAAELASTRGREAGRLASRVQTALREQGVGGLIREVANYVEWQLGRKSQP